MITVSDYIIPMSDHDVPNEIEDRPIDQFNSFLTAAFEAGHMRRVTYTSDVDGCLSMLYGAIDTPTTSQLRRGDYGIYHVETSRVNPIASALGDLGSDVLKHSNQVAHDIMQHYNFDNDNARTKIERQYDLEEIVAICQTLDVTTSKQVNLDSYLAEVESSRPIPLSYGLFQIAGTLLFAKCIEQSLTLSNDLRTGLFSLNMAGT